MSILINMEMPTSCNACKLASLVDISDGFAYGCRALKEMIYNDRERLPNCPLIPIPPHGRLIDADELIEKQKEDAEIFIGSTNYGDKVRYDEAMNAVANIVNAPTVIPADKDGET